MGDHSLAPDFAFFRIYIRPDVLTDDLQISIVIKVDSSSNNRDTKLKLNGLHFSLECSYQFYRVNINISQITHYFPVSKST